MPCIKKGTGLNIFHTFGLVDLNIKIKTFSGRIYPNDMKKSLFKIVARVNKWILPRYSKRDLGSLSKFDQALIAFRYWVTKNSLE